MKIKTLTNEQLIISIDRLTRFKDPEIKYLRVFKELILSNLIEPKFKKSELDEMNYEKIRDFAQQIINYSLTENTIIDTSFNKKLFDYENSIFHLSENTKKLLNNNINYAEILKLLPEEIPINLKFLKSLAFKEKQHYCFPVEKVIICEGVTEEILLPTFAKFCNYDFMQNGVYVISAGGKNQVVKYFYNYANILKIPIFVLLDSDAQENLKQIKPKLRDIDKIHILKSGEFEDLLPNSLIVKALNYATKNISIAPFEELRNATSKVEFLEEFFKHRGLHEFKKAEFAHFVKENIKEKDDISEEIKEIFEELKNL